MVNVYVNLSLVIVTEQQGWGASQTVPTVSIAMAPQILQLS